MSVRTMLFLVLILSIGVAAAQAGTMVASSKSVYSKGAAGLSNAADSSAGSDDAPATPGRLARVTAYWPGEDYYTNHRLSATGCGCGTAFVRWTRALFRMGAW